MRARAGTPNAGSARVAFTAAGCAVAAFALTISITFASASSLPLTAPKGLHQAQSTEQVRADLQDQFNIGATAPLAGQGTDFHSGASWADDAGPTWTTFTAGSPSTDWVNESSNFVRRPFGAISSAALVPWLVRDSSVRIDMRQLSTTSAGGVLMGADGSGSNGLIAAGYWDGSTFRFGIFLLAGGTPSPCSALVDIGAASGNRWRIEMTFSPALAGTATASLVKSGGGGGTFTTSSTCSTAVASGPHAGMYSYAPDPTRYDLFLARL